jgi:predicted AAA+ superfamily ATPase
MKMATNVAVLTTNQRTREALGSIRSNVLLASSFGSGKSYSMIVAMLADLDRAQGRHELEYLIGALKTQVPVVLMSTKAGAPRTDAAFQALTHVTWLVGREVYIAPNADAVARMVFARQAKAEAALIASATVEDGKLIVWSCEPRRYAVAASEIPARGERDRQPHSLEDWRR